MIPRVEFLIFFNKVPALIRTMRMSIEIHTTHIQILNSYHLHHGILAHSFHIHLRRLSLVYN